MTDNDKPSFVQVMDKLFGCFNTSLSADVINTYFEALRDLTIQQFQFAAVQAIRSLKWFPKVAELRELVPKRPETDPLFRAAQAWATAVKHGVTNRKLLDFEDPLINACIRHLGGLEHFARLGRSECERFVRPQFIKHYIEMLEYEVLPANCIAPLTCGITNTNTVELISCESAGVLPNIEVEGGSEHHSIVEGLARTLNDTKR